MQVLVAIMIASCTKSPTNSPAFEESTVFTAYRLSHTIEDQSTMMPRSFFIDSKDNKWITYSTKSGLSGIITFDGNLGDVFPNPASSFPLQIGTSLVAHSEDANGAIYFTGNSGNYFEYRLYRYAEGEWTYWDVSGVPCRELFFNKSDSKLYFIYGKEVHRVGVEANFSDTSQYERVNFKLQDDPQIIQANFDGREIHLLSSDRYYVINPAGELLFHTTKFDDISFVYIYAGDTATSIFTLGGPARQHLYKLHEGRWARYPLSNISLSTITVDHNDEIYVNAAEPDYSVGRYREGNILFFTYGEEKKRVASSAPVVVDNNNVKWVATAEGLVRLP